MHSSREDKGLSLKNMCYVDPRQTTGGVNPAHLPWNEPHPDEYTIVAWMYWMFEIIRNVPLIINGYDVFFLPRFSIQKPSDYAFSGWPFRW